MQYFDYLQQKWKTLVKGQGIKIISLQEMLQSKLNLVLAQVKAGNTSPDLQNGTLQVVYSLYWAKQMTKQVCKNIINLILVLSYNMNTHFINSENIKTSDPQGLVLNLTCKI